MTEPLGHDAARKCILAIIEGSGMTVFTDRVKNDEAQHDMTSLDLVNVLRGGRIMKGTQTATGWAYRAVTQRMTVEFSFRWNHRKPGAMPDELVIETARRNDQ
jgi:hypothetical protein